MSFSRRAFLAAVKTPRPNFVFILADDLGYGDLGCYGSKTIRTPRLDAMAREGVRFTDFYAGSPFCSPSRASLLTGRYPVRAGVPNVLFPTETAGMPASEVTVAEMLRGAGYATACIGKWHLGDQPEKRAHRQGFDFFFGLPYANDMAKQRDGEPFRAQHAKQELPLMENDRVVEAPVDQSTLTRRYTERAIAFLRANRAKPFFLFLSHTFPHLPLYASKEFEGRSPAGLYADTVEELDASVGTVLDELKALGVDGRTMVVFTSDNGQAPGGARAADPRWKPTGSSGGLRAGKASTYEGGMRVPGIFWQPGRIPAGRTESTVASALDLLPTVAEMAGVKLPRGRVIDGSPLTGLLGGKPMPERLFCYYFGGQLQAVRRGRWKLVLKITEYPDRPSSLWYKLQPELFERHYRLKAEPELYDLETDPGEKRNRAEAEPALVGELAAAAAAFDQRLKRGS